MASLRTSVIPSRLFPSSACPIRLQRRWAQVHHVRFVTARHNSDRLLEKYRAKLDRKAKNEGHESIDSLKQAYQDKISELRSKAAAAVPTYPVVTSSLQQAPPPPPRPQAEDVDNAIASSSKPSSNTGPTTTPGIKPLSGYLDLDKVSNLPNKEIEYIWRLRHASDPLSLCAVIPVQTYNRIYRAAQRHPRFILPLPQPDATTAQDHLKDKPSDNNSSTSTSTSSTSTDQKRSVAADIHYLQWTFHPPATQPTTTLAKTKNPTSNTHTSTVLFTHLASFKSHGSYAQPHTTITHHLDLADSHGLVLLNGSVVRGKAVTVDQGRWLVMCLQRFYDFDLGPVGEGGRAGGGKGVGGGGESNADSDDACGSGNSDGGRQRRRGLLERFSNGDREFRIDELLDEAERLG